MISLQNIRNISYVTSRANPLWNTTISAKLVSRTKPAELYIHRNATIYTRNILIQKLNLENVNNWGIALIVSVTINDRSIKNI